MDILIYPNSGVLEQLSLSRVIPICFLVDKALMLLAELVPSSA